MSSLSDILLTPAALSFDKNNVVCMQRLLCDRGWMLGDEREKGERREAEVRVIRRGLQQLKQAQTISVTRAVGLTPCIVSDTRETRSIDI